MKPSGEAFGLNRNQQQSRKAMAQRLPVDLADSRAVVTASNPPLDRSRRAAESWARRIRRQIQPRYAKTGVVLSGDDAYQYLVQIRADLIRAGKDLIDSHSPYDWIVLTRSLNLAVLTTWGLAEGEDGGAASIQRIMENLAGSSQRIDVVDLHPESPLSNENAFQLSKLIFLSAWVDKFEQQIRSVVKGVKLQITSGNSHVPVRSRMLSEMLQGFDTRNLFSLIERWQEEITSPEPLTNGLSMIAAYPFRIGEANSLSWIGPLPKRVFEVRKNRFTIRTFRLQIPTASGLPKGAIENFPEPEEVIALICFAHAMHRWVVEAHDTAGVELPRRGFLDVQSCQAVEIIRSGIYSRDLQDWLRERDIRTPSPERMLTILQNLYLPTERSLPGRIIYASPGGEQMRIDLAALAWHLAISLRVDPRGGGPLVNIDAANFELTVQDVIQRSEFPTPAHLLELRGRDLKIDGKPVTDIDAILVIGEQLFLISCKNVLPRLKYMAGDFKTVRNAQSRVDAALEEWSVRIKRIVENPTGDNYDFSNYVISGFVLTPELIFSSDPLAWQEVPIAGKESLCFYGLDDIDHLVMMLEMAAWPDFPRSPKELPHYMREQLDSGSSHRGTP